MAWTKRFEELGKADVQQAGGKGASLGEMTQAGIPVPPGFVVLSLAFDQFLDESSLKDQIRPILKDVDHQKVSTVEKASKEIQTLIEMAEMPVDIQYEIAQASQSLGAEWVAVRSSATAEDGSAAAWAGQLESYLNTKQATLLSNVKRCWASLFTSRAMIYRFEKRLEAQDISVAVVVQKMVASEVSGVAFSVHPVTQNPDQLIIEACLGLGEALVSGQVTPDSYVVQKSSRHILEKQVSEQEQVVRRVGQANAWVDSGSEGSRQKLSDQEIQELSGLTLQIESHYGFPVDVEWVRENGKFYIVQSRPITTLIIDNL